MTKLILIEDQTILKDSLKSAICSTGDITVTADATDAQEAPELIEKFPCDIVLMDICTENGHSGIDAAAQIKKRFPKVKIMLMTALPEISFLQRAKLAGVNSFIYKDVPTQELFSAIRQTVSGYDIFPNKTRGKLPNDAVLTEAEMQVLRLVCEAKDRKTIADEIHLSEATVKTYISNILSKTGYTSISRLAIYAVSNGLIDPNIN